MLQCSLSTDVPLECLRHNGGLRCISFPALRCNKGKKNKFRMKHSQYKDMKYVSLSRHYTNKSVH